MLLMHNLDAHRKAGTDRRKISSLLPSLLETEIIYSSDSECEYRITTTVSRIVKVKPDTSTIHGSDDDSKTSGRITRSGSSANVKREALDVDKADSNVGDPIMSCHVCGIIAASHLLLQEHIKNEHETANENDQICISSEFCEEKGDNLTLEKSYGVAYRDSTKRLRAKRFSCDVCAKQFKQKAALAKHMKLHYPIEDGDDEYEQNASDNYETEGSDVIDAKVKPTSGFPCNICGKIVESKDQILKHFKVFHPDDEDALSVIVDVANRHEGIGFPCTSCDTIHSDRVSLQQHLQKAHQINSKDNKTIKYTCELCAKVFYRPKCFATHLKKHNEIMVEKRRTKSPKKKTHLCSFCGKSYPGSNHLKIHLRIHTGERPFKCQYCDKTFAIKKTWQDHTYSHTGEKPYSCPIENCGKRFTHSTGVRQHMQCCHSSEKQFQCPHCDKKCSKKTHLEDHIRSHTGERPYECKYCGIRFRLTSTLRIHHRTHTGERPFVCKVCNRGFIKSYGLKQHMKSKRNCLPTSIQPTLTRPIDQQHQQEEKVQPHQQPEDQSIDHVIVADDVQFHQLLILPSHEVHEVLS